MDNWGNGADPFAGERHALRKDANFIGLITLVINVLLQLVFIGILLLLKVTGLVAVNISDKYYGMGLVLFLGVYALTYGLIMGPPAPILSAITRRRINPFSRFSAADGSTPPLQVSTILLALLAGLSICVLANFATSYIVSIFEGYGIYPPEMPDYIDKSTLSLVLNIAIFALMPAIFEEMVFRGYILRSLLPYGEGFAIVVSSVLFALMHGNILQIPFALLVGLTLGYIAVRTGRIWPSMILHFLNNAMSSVLQYAALFCSEKQSNQLTLIVFALVGLIGMCAIIALFAKNSPLVHRLPPRSYGMSSGACAKVLLLSPMLIISVILSLVITVLSTKLGGAA